MEKTGKNVQVQKGIQWYMYHCKSILEAEFCTYNSESRVSFVIETIFFNEGPALLAISKDFYNLGQDLPQKLFYCSVFN